MIEARIEQALRTPTPVHELRNLVERLLADGQSSEAILGLLEQARQQLRQADHESDEETVMDVMDFLVGWCSPHMQLPLKK
jgi:hypothetical protein